MKTLAGPTYLLGAGRSALRAVTVRWCKTNTGDLWHLYVRGTSTTMCGHPVQAASAIVGAVVPGLHAGRPCKHCVRVRERWYA